jgi:predicted nucleotidyltransferase
MNDHLTNVIDTLKAKLSAERAILFAYLFGSQARHDVGKLSDMDIAIYLDENVDTFSYRLRCIEAIMKIIKDESVDVVVLNKATPLLRHEVIGNSIILKDNRRYRIYFEVKTLQEYLDTAYLRGTQVSFVRESLKTGTYFG